jgi:hypothetical protein
MTGAERITKERQRHFEVEGWTPNHDDQHACGEMSQAASCYAMIANAQCRWQDHQIDMSVPAIWPWETEWWKPKDNPIRNLEIAGSLLAAEIDRLQRLNENKA